MSSEKKEKPLTPEPAGTPALRTGPPHSALLRNLVHAGAFFVFAVPLGALADPRHQIPYGVPAVIGVMLCGTVFNMLLLPRLESGRRIARPGEGFVTGQWLYPAALALCFALYPPFAAMGAWAALAGGDAAASFAGRKLPRPRLPWNEKKTWAGLAAFVLAALPLCYFALYWCPSQQFLKSDGWPELPYVWTLAVLAAASGAILESLPGGVDDNLRVPLGVGCVLWLGGAFLSFSTRGLPADTHVQPEQFLRALWINAALGAGVLWFRFADLPGTALGVAFGVIVFFFAQWQGYALFLLFVLLGSVLSKAGLARKAARGVAEARAGKRGIGNVAANLLVPALCCLAYPVSQGGAAMLMAFAGAIAAALADTASSEIGTLSAREPVLITTLKPVPHGANGAISGLGSLAALAASGLVAGMCVATGFFALILKNDLRMSGAALAVATCIVIVAGMAGTFLDSLLGATVEDRWPGVHKGGVNFACTLCGAGVAGVLTHVAIRYFSIK